VPSYILTGAPGAGKTAVLRVLETSGYLVVEEAATDVSAVGNALGRAEPWHDHDFIDEVVTLRPARAHPVEASGRAAQAARLPRPAGGVRLITRSQRPRTWYLASVASL
jgi:predicted ATPase